MHGVLVISLFHTRHPRLCHNAESFCPHHTYVYMIGTWLNCAHLRERECVREFSSLKRTHALVVGNSLYHRGCGR